MQHKAYYIDRDGHRYSVIEDGIPPPSGDPRQFLKSVAMCIARMPIGAVRVVRGYALHECP